MSQLSHIDESGNAKMVDVGQKQNTEREAIACGEVQMSAETFALIATKGHKKGDVLAVARIAGIQAAKACSSLIPLCHPLMLTSIDVDFDLESKPNTVKLKSRCKVNGQTGVEMEALTAVSVAALTIYDMCKAVDKAMIISDLQLLEKSGGRSGHYIKE
jgi:cyclic pyranopterin phosphate synthase